MSEQSQDFIDMFLDAQSDDLELESVAESNAGLGRHAAHIQRKMAVGEVVAQCLMFLVAG